MQDVQVRLVMDLWKNLLCFSFQYLHAIFPISHMWMSAA